MPEQIIAKYQHTKATYEQLYAKYEQICAKHEQTCEYKTSLNDQRSKNKTEFNGQGTFQKIPTNKPANTRVLHPDEMKNCRISRATLVCRFHSRKKREREPSRIPYRKVIKLFRKARIIRHAARSYLHKCIPSSSKLKLMLSEYNRYHFTEWFARSKCELSSRKYFVRQNLYFAVVRLRTLKHKNSPLFCMYVDERMLKQLKHCQVQTYHVAHRIICLSGDVEENPGPSDQCNATNKSGEYGTSVVNSVSMLETRLSELNRPALDVGGGGDCFFRAVSHQAYGNPNNHF